MDAIFQPGACWLVIVDNRCTVLRIHNSNKCQFPGESGEHPLDRVQEWLSPVWTATMLKCVRCLGRGDARVPPVLEAGGPKSAAGCTARYLRRVPKRGRDASAHVLLARLSRTEEHTSELQSPRHLLCRLLLEKKKVAARKDDAVEADEPAPHELGERAER